MVESSQNRKGNILAGILVAFVAVAMALWTYAPLKLSGAEGSQTSTTLRNIQNYHNKDTSGESADMLVFPRGITHQQDIYSSSRDGCVLSTGNNWSLTHSASSDDTRCTDDTLTIGVEHTDASSYSLIRGFVVFDTRDIPDHARIQKASLSLFISSATSDLSMLVISAHHFVSRYATNDSATCPYIFRSNTYEELSHPIRLSSQDSCVSIPVSYTHLRAHET